MLTARGEEHSKVTGLDAGVDDYVTKPFSTRELLARMKAVLRRSGGDGSEVVQIGGGLQIDLSQHRILATGEAVHVGPTEFRLLHFFMTHPSVSTPGPSCSTRCGGATCTSRSGLSTSTSDGCARRSSHTASTTSCRRCVAWGTASRRRLPDR